MEGLQLIDVASEDDLLLASPPPFAPSPAGSVEAAKASDLATTIADSPVGRGLTPDGVLEMSESPKPRKPKSGVNLRKSLAWDSAFFTGEGVLNTEELAIVNSTFRKAEASKLPGIAEEGRRSGESTLTLDSESCVLESLETELFDNVRTSIQRMLGKSDKAQGVGAAGLETHRRTANVPLRAARKKVDQMPPSKMKLPISTGQGVVGSKQQPKVASRELPPAKVASPGAAEAKSSSRIPRNLPRAAVTRAPSKTVLNSGIADKRSSTGGVVNRQMVGRSVNSSASVASRSIVVPKSGSRKTSGMMSSATTSTSHGTSKGATLHSKTKSPGMSHKTGAAQRIAVQSSSRPAINKDNPASASRNKILTRRHGDRTSPSISPSSSVDSMLSFVSEAPSSASTVGKLNHTSESVGAKSSSSSPSLRKSNNRPPIMRRPPTIEANHSSGTTSGDHLKTSTNSSTQGQGLKPSGLRMPTPKIGYFDAEKSLDQNSGAFVQPTKLKCSLPTIQKHQLSSTQIIKPASSTFGKQESKPTAAPCEEINASQSNKSPLSPLEVAEMGVEPSQVIEKEARTHQTGLVVEADVAKENIPTQHQNTQSNGGLSELTIELASQKLASISLVETTDLVSRSGSGFEL